MSTAWIINHNLGRKPSITVRDSGGIERWGDVTHSGDSVAVVTFSLAISGEAYCI